MKIAVIGLGLIGGSVAMALKDFENAEVTGVVRSQRTLELAVERQVCHKVTLDPAQAVADADVVWLCMQPRAILDFLEEYKERFKPGALVTDVCGVKTAVMEAARVLPNGVDFIGCHPMAGKETSKLDNAEATLFRNAHFIITPRAESAPEHIDLMERMAKHMGFRDVVNTTPEQHLSLIHI